VRSARCYPWPPEGGDALKTPFIGGLIVGLLTWFRIFERHH